MKKIILSLLVLFLVNPGLYATPADFGHSGKSFTARVISGKISIKPADYALLETAAGGNLINSGLTVELWKVQYKDALARASQKPSVYVFFKNRLSDPKPNLQKTADGLAYSFSGVQDASDLVVLIYFNTVPVNYTGITVRGFANDGSDRKLLHYATNARMFIGQEKMYGLYSLNSKTAGASADFVVTLHQAGEIRPMGFFDAIGDFFSDALDAIVDAVETAGGFIISTATGLILQAGAIIYNVIVYGNLPRYRNMTQAEYDWANSKIYNGSLPSRGTFVISNLMSVNHRPFTIPMGGLILLNLGDAYDNPATFTNSAYPTAGEVFIHELGHAWQINNNSVIKYLDEGMCNSFNGSAAYKYECGKDWTNYNFEQQASIVNKCYAKELSNTPLSNNCEKLYVDKYIRKIEAYAQNYSGITEIIKLPASGSITLTGSVLIANNKLMLDGTLADALKMQCTNYAQFTATTDGKSTYQGKQGTFSGTQPVGKISIVPDAGGRSAKITISGLPAWGKNNANAFLNELLFSYDTVVTAAKSALGTQKCYASVGLNQFNSALLEYVISGDFTCHTSMPAGQQYILVKKILRPGEPIETMDKGDLMIDKTKTKAMDKKVF